MTDSPRPLSFRGEGAPISLNREKCHIYITVALELVNEQRSRYGLRYHDHERYRFVKRSWHPDLSLTSF